MLTADGYGDRDLLEPAPAPVRHLTVAPFVHLRVLFRRLREVHGMPLTAAHIDGRFRRYSGDFSETGRGELLAWSPA